MDGSGLGGSPGGWLEGGLLVPLPQPHDTAQERCRWPSSVARSAPRHPHAVGLQGSRKKPAERPPPRALPHRAVSDVCPLTVPGLSAPAPPALAVGDRCRGGHSTPHLQRVPRWAPGKRGQSRIQESHNTTNLLFQPLAHTRPPVPPLRAAHRLKGKNSPHSTWWGGAPGKGRRGSQDGGGRPPRRRPERRPPPWAPARSASRLPPCGSLPPGQEPAADLPPPAPTLGSRPRGGAEQAPTGVLLFEVISRRAKQGAPRTEGGSPPGARRPRLWPQRTERGPATGCARAGASASPRTELRPSGSRTPDGAGRLPPTWRLRRAAPPWLLGLSGPLAPLPCTSAQGPAGDGERRPRAPSTCKRPGLRCPAVTPGALGSGRPRGPDHWPDSSDPKPGDEEKRGPSGRGPSGAARSSSCRCRM